MHYLVGLDRGVLVLEGRFADLKGSSAGERGEGKGGRERETESHHQHCSDHEGLDLGL